MNIRHAHRRLLAVAIGGSLLVAACGGDEAAPLPTPRAVTSLPVNVAEPAPPVPTPVVYTVVPGDTMARIARAHDVTLAELLAANDLPNPGVIEPGLEVLIPPLPEPAPVVTFVATEPIVPPAPPVDEAWYQPAVDRLPALPEELEEARPLLLAGGAVLLVLMGVGVIALGLQLVYPLVAAGASAFAFGGRGLQAAVAGIPRSSGHSEDVAASAGDASGWRRRFDISRLSLPIAQPRFRRSSSVSPTLDPPAIEVPSSTSTGDLPPETDTAPAHTLDAAPVPSAAPPAVPAAPPTAAPGRPPVPADALTTARTATAPPAPPLTPPPASPPGGSFEPLPVLPALETEAVHGLVPPPSAPLAAPEEQTALGPIARLRRAVADRAAIVVAAIAAAAASAASHLRAAVVVAARAIARWTRIAAIATWHASLRLLRAGGRLAVRGARSAAALPRRLLHERSEQRRRKQFRQRVESSTAARMRLGLRQDNETHLQESLDESLSEGWRLEAAWCLQLLAEEADRRSDRALAELRRVRARELIRDHAIEEEARP